MITAWLIAFVGVPGFCTPAAELETDPRDRDSLVRIERPDASLFHTRIELRAGARHDPPGKEGLARLVAAWLDRNTDYRVQAEPLAVTMTRTVETSSQTAHACPRLPAQPPLPSREAFAELRSHIIEELAREIAQPGEAFESALERLAYSGELVPAPTRGTRAGLASLELEDLLEWLGDNYEASTIGLAGPLAGMEGCTEAATDRRRTEWPTIARPSLLPADDRGPDVVVVDHPGAASAWIGLLARTSTSAIPTPDEIVAWSLLFGGRSTPVHRALRGTVPAVDPLLVWQSASIAPIVASAQTPSTRVASYVEGLLRELGSIAGLGIEEEDVELGRALAIGRTAMDWASPRRSLGQSIRSLRGLGARSWPAAEAGLACLTSAQIRRATRRITDLPRLRFVVIVNAQPELLSALARIRGVRRVHVISLEQLL